jgi:hypothetical protein
MKNHILFCFFVIQVRAYAQDGTITNANFENKLIVLDKNGSNTNEIEQTSVIAYNGALNHSYYLRCQIKKINISQNIYSDY